MSMHSEPHNAERIGWLRAAVLGANDGLISTSALVVGVASAGSSSGDVILAALAGMVAGALSMAAGEYVSVSSQGDAENANVERERRELREDPEGERAELATIYVNRGLSPGLARQVAEEMMAKDALGAHLRDELGMHEVTRARPLQAAVASALAFAVGAGTPVILAAFVPASHIRVVVTAATLAMLTVLGGTGAYLGGAPMAKGAGRVALWGAAAMAGTALVGRLFGTVGMGA